MQVDAKEIAALPKKVGRKFLLFIDWIEYGAKALKAIAGGVRVTISDWPDRPSRPDIDTGIPKVTLNGDQVSDAK
jgi:hypothetical protein